jgi:hypothetical protein
MDVTDLLLTKPADMTLSLYLRPIHPEFFRIFNWQSYRSANYEAELWITGLSHVLTVRHTGTGRSAERCVTEVIAPEAMAMPERGRVEHVSLASNQEASYGLRNGFRYQLSAETEQVADDDVFAAIYEDLRNQGHREGLSCEFRVDGFDRSLWPLAITVPNHTRGGFLLHAWHVFPDFRSILKTQTLIEVPEE